MHTEAPAWIKDLSDKQKNDLDAYKTAWHRHNDAFSNLNEDDQLPAAYIPSFNALQKIRFDFLQDLSLNNRNDFAALEQSWQRALEASKPQVAKWDSGKWVKEQEEIGKSSLDARVTRYLEEFYPTADDPDVTDMDKIATMDSEGQSLSKLLGERALASDPERAAKIAQTNLDPEQRAKVVKQIGKDTLTDLINRHKEKQLLAEKNSLGLLAWSRKMQIRLAEKVHNLESILKEVENSPEELRQRAEELQRGLQRQDFLRYFPIPIFQTPEMENQRAELAQLITPTYGNQNVPRVVQAQQAVASLQRQILDTLHAIEDFKSLELATLLEEIKSLSDQSRQHAHETGSQEQLETLNQLRDLTQGWLTGLSEIKKRERVHFRWLLDLRKQLSVSGLSDEIQAIDGILSATIKTQVKELAENRDSILKRQPHRRPAHIQNDLDALWNLQRLLLQNVGEEAAQTYQIHAMIAFIDEARDDLRIQLQQSLESRITGAQDSLNQLFTSRNSSNLQQDYRALQKAGVLNSNPAKSGAVFFSNHSLSAELDYWDKQVHMLGKQIRDQEALRNTITTDSWRIAHYEQSLEEMRGTLRAINRVRRDLHLEILFDSQQAEALLAHFSAQVSAELHANPLADEPQSFGRSFLETFSSNIKRKDFLSEVNGAIESYETEIARSLERIDDLNVRPQTDEQQGYQLAEEPTVIRRRIPPSAFSSSLHLSAIQRRQELNQRQFVSLASGIQGMDVSNWPNITFGFFRSMELLRADRLMMRTICMELAAQARVEVQEEAMLKKKMRQSEPSTEEYLLARLALNKTQWRIRDIYLQIKNLLEIQGDKLKVVTPVLSNAVARMKSLRSKYEDDYKLADAAKELAAFSRSFQQEKEQIRTLIAQNGQAIANRGTDDEVELSVLRKTVEKINAFSEISGETQQKQFLYSELNKQIRNQQPKIETRLNGLLQNWQDWREHHIDEIEQYMQMYGRLSDCLNLRPKPNDSESLITQIENDRTILEKNLRPIFHRLENSSPPSSLQQAIQRLRQQIRPDNLQHQFQPTATFENTENFRFACGSLADKCTAEDIEAFRQTWNVIADKAMSGTLLQSMDASVYGRDLERIMAAREDPEIEGTHLLRIPIDEPEVENIATYMKLVGTALITFRKIKSAGAANGNEDAFEQQLANTLADRLTIAYGRDLSAGELDAKLKLGSDMLNRALFIEQEDITNLISDEPHLQLAGNLKILSPLEMRDKVSGVQLKVYPLELDEEEKNLLDRKYNNSLSEPAWRSGYQFIPAQLHNWVGDCTPIRQQKNGNWIVELASDDSRIGPTVITVLTERHLAGRKPILGQTMSGFVAGQSAATQINTPSAANILDRDDIDHTAYRKALDRSGTMEEKKAYHSKLIQTKREYIKQLEPLSNDITAPNCVRVLAARAFEEINDANLNHQDAGKKMQDIYETFTKNREGITDFLHDLPADAFMKTDEYPRLMEMMNNDFKAKVDELIVKQWGSDFFQAYKTVYEQFSDHRFDLLFNKGTKILGLLADGVIKHIAAACSGNDAIPQVKSLATETVYNIGQFIRNAEDASTGETAVEKIEHALDVFEDKREFFEELHKDLGDWNQHPGFAAFYDAMKDNFVAKVETLVSTHWETPDFNREYIAAYEQFSSERAASLQSYFDLEKQINATLQSIATLRTIHQGSPADKLLSIELPELLNRAASVVRSSDMMQKMRDSLSAIETAVSHLDHSDGKQRNNHIHAIKTEMKAILRAVDLHKKDEIHQITPSTSHTETHHKSSRNKLA